MNKEQKLKLIIGLCVIVPLTMYLFLFYSSTFYSAFFKNTDSIENLMDALFDAQALSHAAEMGTMAFLFVLCAPIIFLGLGFCLHFFSVQQGVGKYIKMAAMVGVTFAFDCILAYCIGHKFHEIGRITGAVPRDQDYSISLAVTDENIWVVIFCGFVVYIIWGIVFDMCMSAYNNMDLNKTRLMAIKDEITSLEAKKKSVKGEIEALRSHIAENNKMITSLMTRLGKEVYIDYAAIRTEMNNFFAGWVTQMQILSMPQTDKDEATVIFNSTIGDLLKNK
ncbi:MAG: hypothetical protein NC344_10720 [Bacteroidales bacterium]|nr:hypothetical protein [Bacteroidales bacterium]MCM1148278.1 hypothetical protein [Bacteroidales bacterium]MCM1206601.1 hypothetical protein [Bacillota bacterium]MCM1510497.1 hypothetical protein [Clostridium sp.]